MKSVEETVCCVVDYGSFTSLAQKLGEVCSKVYYHRPVNTEYRKAWDFAIGEGVPGIECIESFMEPDIVKEVDWYCFPDIGYVGEQKYLRGIGKPVFGSLGGDELERLRTKFLKVIKEVGLPVPKYDVIRGLDNLESYLKQNEEKWVKLNEFRGDMETWFHQDYEHSKEMLLSLRQKWLGIERYVVFVVQENIPDAQEIGYDGMCIQGQFPESSFQGYEKKNELYLGAMTAYKDLPEEVRFVNESIAPKLTEYGYQNFFATEIRNQDGTPYYIDPTNRMPGQTGEQLLETMTNLPSVMWHGAHGELIKPEWCAKFATSATLRHKGNKDAPKYVRIPKEAQRWVKPNHYCQTGYEDFWFAPNGSDDLGPVIGIGDTIEDAIEAVKANFEAIGDDSIEIRPEGFKDLLEDIHAAEDKGIEFSDQPVPEPETALNL